MIITIPYFGDREEMLSWWQEAYQLSGNTEPVCLLTDGTTVPTWWSYNSVVVNSVPSFIPYTNLHKADWIKAQSYDAVGESLVLDLDCIVTRSLRPLIEISGDICMVKDVRQDRVPTWVKGLHYNCGVVILRSSIFSDYKKIVAEHPPEPRLGFYYRVHGQLTFSRIFNDRSGTELPIRWNSIRAKDPEADILHYCGPTKSEIPNILEVLRSRSKR